MKNYGSLMSLDLELTQRQGMDGLELESGLQLK